MLCFSACSDTDTSGKSSKTDEKTTSSKVTLGSETEGGGKTPVHSYAPSSSLSTGESTTNPPSDTGLKISTADEFLSFAKQVANGTSFDGETVTLEKDINLSGKSWTPIGTFEKPFKGTFDGKGHTISNMKIELKDITVDSGKDIYLGLFGFVSDGKILNLNMTRSEIKVENSKGYGFISAGLIAGLVIGYGGDIAVENCSAAGRITVSSATNNHLDLGGLLGDFCENFDRGSATLKGLTSRVDIFAESKDGAADCGGIVGNVGLRSDKGELYDLDYKGTIERGEDTDFYNVGGICGGLFLEKFREIGNCRLHLTIPQIGEYVYSAYQDIGLAVGQEATNTVHYRLKEITASATFEGKTGDYDFVGKTYGNPTLEKCIVS